MRKPISAVRATGEEFAKLSGARALFRYSITLSVTTIVKFSGKIDDHLE
jgi:hypothetical protein